MDLNIQECIYALDALEVSVRSNLRLITAMKALMAPKKVELREDPDPEPCETPDCEKAFFYDGETLHEINPKHPFIATFEPPADLEPYPPCMHCEADDMCHGCSSKLECLSVSCEDCTFEELCMDNEPEPVCLHCLDCNGTECKHYMECAGLTCAECPRFKMCMELITNG